MTPAHDVRAIHVQQPAHTESNKKRATQGPFLRTIRDLTFVT
jgi:hypothetical protein